MTKTTYSSNASGAGETPKRYDMVSQVCMGEPWQDLEERPDGDYIRYDDYATLHQQNAELASECEKAFARLARADDRDYLRGSLDREQARNVELLDRLEMLKGSIRILDENRDTLRAQLEKAKAGITVSEAWRAKAEIELAGKSKELEEARSEIGLIKTALAASTDQYESQVKRLQKMVLEARNKALEEAAQIVEECGHPCTALLLRNLISPTQPQTDKP